jgi:hypothetical protein
VLVLQGYQDFGLRGGLALTARSTINLPSAAPASHLAFNVKSYIFVGSGLSRELAISLQE